MVRLTNKTQSDNLHKRLDGYREGMKNKNISASMNPAYEDMSYVSNHELIYEKLGQLEDIEEELGIELATLFKALRSGIHIIDDGYPYNDRVNLIYSNSSPCGFKGKVGDHCVFFKDYGKTWSLTKEEL